MKVVSKELIENAIENAGPDGLDLREDYSGRGMYGESCFGFVGDDSVLMSVMIEVAVLDAELARNLARRMRTDSMGRQSIFYFPGYQLGE